MTSDELRRRKRDYEIGDTVVVSDEALFMPYTPATVQGIRVDVEGTEWVQVGRGGGTAVIPAWKLKKASW